MAKFPYGGFDVPPEYPDAWSKLNTVAEYLEDGDKLPPHLAEWLANAGEMEARVRDDPGRD